MSSWKLEVGIIATFKIPLLVTPQPACDVTAWGVRKGGLPDLGMHHIEKNAMVDC